MFDTVQKATALELALEQAFEEEWASKKCSIEAALEQAFEQEWALKQCPSTACSESPQDEAIDHSTSSQHGERWTVTQYRPLHNQSNGACEIALAMQCADGRLPMVVGARQYKQILIRREQRRRIEQERLEKAQPKDGRRIGRVKYLGRSLQAYHRHETENSRFAKRRIKAMGKLEVSL